MQLRRHPSVSLVEEDGVVVGASEEEYYDSLFFGVEETSGPLKGVPWHLDRLDQLNLPLDNHFEPVWTGKGVDVYILDTGIRYNHQEFDGRAKFIGFDPVDELAGESVLMQGSDCYGHGTHIASVVAGRTFGVAREATVYSVRTLQCNNTALWSVVLSSLERVANHIQSTQKPSVISLSFIGVYNQVVNDVIADIVARGIPVVVAAGNVGGEDACEYSPASSPMAITVAASDDEDYLFRDFPGSAVGPCVDIVAPGVDIVGADFRCPSCFAVLDGTSQAAPLVAGILSLYLQEDSSLTPRQLKERLLEEAVETVHVSGVDRELGLKTVKKLTHIDNSRQHNL